MGLTHLFSHQSLITEPSDELLTLASFLEIPADIDLEDDHIYIANVYDRHSMYLSSSPIRAPSDVWISPDRFYELLQDILTGIPAIEAFNKQGYTFNN